MKNTKVSWVSVLGICDEHILFTPTEIPPCYSIILNKGSFLELKPHYLLRNRMEGTETFLPVVSEVLFTFALATWEAGGWVSTFVQLCAHLEEHCNEIMA